MGDTLANVWAELPPGSWAEFAVDAQPICIDLDERRFAAKPRDRRHHRRICGRVLVHAIPGSIWRIRLIVPAFRVRQLTAGLNFSLPEERQLGDQRVAAEVKAMRARYGPPIGVGALFCCARCHARLEGVVVAADPPANIREIMAR